ncbi:MAG: hypothetical protein AAF493_10590 [Pseudomonadota bacterium]
MARQRKKSKNKRSSGGVAKPVTTERTARRSPFRAWRTMLALVALVGVSTAGLAAYQRNHEIAHDLSVIGNDTPTVVQVHDPGCPLCQRLKRNVNSAKGEFGDSIQFRIAHMGTAKGRMFANRHDVGHVTLLLFDKSGRKTRTITGVTEVPTLKRAFRDLVESG